MATVPDRLSSPQVREYFDLLNSIGKAGAHGLFPNDFELYMFALELVSIKGKPVDFLIFPVMPSNISESEPNIQSIKKTVGGITTLNTSTFIPRDIHISGSFGRRFKILFGRGASGVATGLLDANAIQLQITSRTFSNQIKTGYGATKVLENILKLSNKVDKEGNPFKLYLYNLAFGESYLVKVMTKDFKQSLPESNLLWNYDVTFKAIAPLVGVRENPLNSLIKLMGVEIASKGIDAVLKTVKSELSIANKFAVKGISIKKIAPALSGLIP